MATLTVSATASLTGAKRIVIKIGSALLVSHGELRARWLDGLAEDVAKDKDANITFEEYSSGSLVPAKATMQGIRDNVAQLGVVYPGYTPSELPVNNVLNDLVRSYMVPGGGMMPQFLQSSFDMLRENQAKAMENMSAMNPITKMPGFEAIKAQQEAFLKAMSGGLGSSWPPAGGEEESAAPAEESGEDLDAIKRQLADLQNKLSKLS